MPIMSVRVKQRPAAIRGALDDQLGVRIEAVAQSQCDSGGSFGVPLQSTAGVETSLAGRAQLLESARYRLGRWTLVRDLQIDVDGSPDDPW